MEILKTIMLFLGGFSYAATCLFAISAWFRLREQRHTLDVLKMGQMKVWSIVASMRLQADFDELRKMKRTMLALVECEKLEEAEEMKRRIADQEQQLMEDVRSFNETFGDIAEVEIHTVKL